VKAAVLLAVGLILAVCFIVCAFYFFTTAGQVREEGEPMDPWLAVSFFVGFASLTAPAFFREARRHRDRARTWLQADEA
jgi:hypothetical protein